MGLCLELVNGEPEPGKRLLVGGKLRRGEVDVDRLTMEMRELASGHRRADRAGESSRHGGQNTLRRGMRQRPADSRLYFRRTSFNLSCGSAYTV
jgi:hypothetical protein